MKIRITEYDSRVEYTLEDDIRLRHRSNGPAIEWNDGFHTWALNNRLHRYYGPARVWPSTDNDNKINWYLHGERV